MEEFAQLDDDSVFVYSEDTAAPAGTSEKILPTPPSRRLSVAQSVRRHKVLTALVFLAVLLMGIPVVYLRSIRSRYYAEALLNVSSIIPKNLIDDREYQVPRYDEFVNQQLATMVRPEITLGALARLKDQASLWQLPTEGRREAAERLGAALQGKRVPNSTSYISVGLEGNRPEGLAEIVTAVVEAYLDREKGQLSFDLVSRLDALNKHKLEVQDEIRKRTELLAGWVKEFGVMALDVRSTESSNQPVQGGRTLADARARRVEAESRLAMLPQRHEVIKKLDLAAEARAQLLSDPSVNNRRSILLTRKSELKAKLVGLSAQHEGRASIDRAIAAIDAELEQTEKEELARLQVALEDRRTARLAEETQAAELEVAQSKRVEEILASDDASQSSKSNRYTSIYYEMQSAKQDLERLNRQLGVVEDRIDVSRLESQNPGPVRLEVPATKPERPLKKSIASLLGLLLAAAIGCSLAVPLIVDATDGHVRNPLDVEKCLGSRPLGWILNRRPETESFARDQVRRIALSLDRERRLFNRAHFAFTSLRSGGGTTRLVLDLAREVRAIGCRVVVIEANALHPDPRLSGAEGRPGLAEVLSGEAHIEDAILPARDTLPDLIPLGNLNGKKFLPGCRNLSSLLTGLFSRYEIMLVDAPPILVSSDAELLAGVTHAAVLVVESDKNLIGEVNRAIQILRQIGPPLIQVILNRVRDFRGHGYYSDLVRQYGTAGVTPSEQAP